MGPSTAPTPMTSTTPPERSVDHPLLYVGLAAVVLARLGSAVFDLSGPGVQAVAAAGLAAFAVGLVLTVLRWVRAERGRAL